MTSKEASNSGWNKFTVQDLNSIIVGCLQNRMGKIELVIDAAEQETGQTFIDMRVADKHIVITVTNTAVSAHRFVGGEEEFIEGSDTNLLKAIKKELGI